MADYTTSGLGGYSAAQNAFDGMNLDMRNKMQAWQAQQAPQPSQQPQQGAPAPSPVAAIAPVKAQPAAVTPPPAANGGYLPASAWDPNKVGKLNGIWDYTRNYQNDTGLANRPTDEYAPYVNYLENTQSGEDGMTRTQTWNEMNWDALPNKGVTKFGKIGEQAVRVNNPEYLNDKSMMYFDPDYGWVTHKSNIQNDDNWLEKLAGNGALMASLAMGGLAGVGLPAGAIAGGVKAGMGALPGVFKGDWQSALMNLAGAGLGSYYGVDPRIIAAGKTAAGYALNGKG